MRVAKVKWRGARTGDEIADQTADKPGEGADPARRGEALRAGVKKGDGGTPGRPDAGSAGSGDAGKSRPRAVPAVGEASPDAGRDRVLAACEGVIDIAAILFNVSGKDLRSAHRSTLAVSRVRQIAMYAAHVRLGFTMGEVGLGFGRDRTTVLHACHQIEDLREDEEFDDIVARVEQVIAVAFGKRAQD